MSNRKPLFSFLLPTYNRAQFLSLAIKSLLQQTFEDFEIVVSNSASPDNTRDVVEGFKDNRIRYIEVDKVLSMGENYQNALNHATGEYIIFFSDDDAFVPSTLQRIEQVISEKKTEMVVFRYAFYTHEKTKEFEREIPDNTLAFFPYTGGTTEITAKHAIEQMFRSYNLVTDVSEEPNHAMPVIGNIVCHHSIFERINVKVQNLFATIPVDLYFITLVLSVVGSYYYLNEPLLVWSRWSRNSTASSNMKGKSLREHFEKLLNGQSLQYVPLKFPLPNNCYANAVLQAKNDLGSALDFLNLDWNAYFVYTYDYLVYLTEAGVDTAREFAEFDEVLAMQPLQLQENVNTYIGLKHKAFKPTIKRKFRITFPSFAKKIAHRLKPNLGKELILISGETADFNNFLECANYLDSHLQQFSHNSKH